MTCRACYKELETNYLRIPSFCVLFFMRPFAKNVFLPAVILFAVANLCLLEILPTSQDGILAQQRKDLSWWTIRSFLALHRRPTVVLIGSSVMTKVSNEGDATYLGKILDARTHHRSQYLEDLISERSSEAPYCASLSIPEMNASDVGVATSVLLKSPHKPDLLVYGIAPRDLMDNALSMPSQTSTYHLLEKIGDLSALAYDARLGFEAKFKFCVNSVLRLLCPLYCYQEEVALKWQHFCGSEIAQFMPKQNVAANLTEKVLVTLHMVPNEFDTAISSLPYDPARREHGDLSNCYIASYNPFRKQLYEAQVQFLSRCLETCQSRGIKVLLVNMPLRADSFKLMPAGFYKRYLNDVQKIAAAKRADFLDFEKNESFVDDDFVDQVHLSGAGGCKFVRCLAAGILERHLLSPRRESVTVAERKPMIAQ